MLYHSLENLKYKHNIFLTTLYKLTPKK